MTDYVGPVLSVGFILIFMLLMIWTIVWKGVALWRSVKRKRIVWFIALLIMNTLSLLEILFLGIFSRIKNARSFRKVHDAWIIFLVIVIILSFNQVLRFLIFLALFLAVVFSVSLIQKSVDRKDWVWTIFGILLIPIIPIIYYFVVVRDESKRGHLTKKRGVKKKKR